MGEQTAASAKDSALLRSALVLLCSHIEGFFEDLIRDALSAYETLAKVIDVLPIEIRICQVIGKADRWANNDPRRRWDLVQTCLHHPLVMDGTGKPPSGINPELHTLGFSNPGTGEVRNLLASMGISDVWKIFTTVEPERLVKEALDAIVNRRNQIVHGDMESTVTRSDVERYLAYIRRLAEAMDRLMRTRISADVGVGDAWAEMAQKGIA